MNSLESWDHELFFQVSSINHVSTVASRRQSTIWSISCICVISLVPVWFRHPTKQTSFMLESLLSWPLHVLHECGLYSTLFITTEWGCSKSKLVFKAETTMWCFDQRKAGIKHVWDTTCNDVHTHHRYEQESTIAVVVKHAPPRCTCYAPFICKPPLVNCSHEQHHNSNLRSRADQILWTR